MIKNEKNKIENVYDNLKKLVEKHLKVNSYDYSCESTLKKIENNHYRQACEILTLTKASFRKLDKCEHVYMTKQTIKRIGKAVAAYAEYVKDRYGDKYPGLCIEDVLININHSCGITTFDVLDGEYYITYAVALFILDELFISGKIINALQYLPDNITEYDVVMPDFSDTCHNRDLIAEMIYLISNRNSGKKSKKNSCVYVNEESLSYKGTREYCITDYHEEITDRERFDSVISLIRKDVIENSIRRFEEKEWDYFEMCCNITDKLNEEKLTELKRLMKEVENEIKIIEKQESAYNPLLAKGYASKCNDNDGFDVFTSESQFEEKRAKMIKIDSMIDKCQALDKKIKGIGFLACSCETFDMFAKEKFYDISDMDKIKYSGCKNPYETIFAFLYLLDSGSNLVWLYNQAAFVLQSAVRQLPWAFDDIYNNDSDDSDEENTDESSSQADETDEEDDNLPEEDCPVTDWIDYEADLYERKYTDACMWSDSDEMDESDFTDLNFAQIVFEKTGTIIPRNVHRYAWLSEDFEKSGFEDGEAKLLGRFCMLINSFYLKEAEGKYFIREFSDDEDEEISDTQEKSEDTADEAEDYRKEIRKLKNEIKALHSERNEYKHKAEKSGKEADELNREIAELRELLNNRDVPVAERKNEIEFPYTLQHRFVVYGGHPSWLRAIKPMLKNIRFIDADVIPNQGLIVNSDAVWVQSNAIGHAFYYKILDITRTNGIPLEYFSYASAEKCAEQIVEYDKSLSIG